VVNDFSRCGYCKVCPGYHDVNSPVENDPDDPRPASDREDYPSDGVPKGRVCPYDALRRKFVGTWSNDNPNHMYFEYTIDDSKCTGCGKCVVQCRKPSQGNGSLRMEVQHNLCVSCNQCNIAKACPIVAEHRRPDFHGAFYRDEASKRFPSLTPPPIAPPLGVALADTTRTAELPCGPGPFGRRPGEEPS
jgi:electron transport complex protein RnfB